MCEWIGRPVKAKRSFLMYKIIRDDGASCYSPGGRASLGKYKTHGELLFYVLGKQVRSPSGPGIMGFKRLRTAQIVLRDMDRNTRIVQLRVPKDAIVREGEWKDRRCIMASAVTPLKYARKK